jgi:hypothetical protein
MPKIDLLAAPTFLQARRLRLCVPTADHAQSYADGVNASMPVLEHVD